MAAKKQGGAEALKRGRGRPKANAKTSNTETVAEVEEEKEAKRARLSDDKVEVTPKDGMASPPTIFGLHFSHGSVPAIAMTFGMGENDQLGYESAERKKPKVVDGLPPAMQVCCGGLHTAVITKDGKVYTFGVNDEGALGRGGAESDVSPMEGEIASMKAIQVSCGDSHSVVLCDDGSVYGSGIYRDAQGKLGFSKSHGKGVVVTTPERILETVSTRRDPVVRIVSGVDHTLALTKNGKLYSWGCGEQGRLGRVAERSSARRKMDIQLETGPIKLPIPSKTPAEGKRIVDIASGAYHSFAIMADGSVYGWGASMSGQTGLEGASNRFFPQKVELLTGKKIVGMAGGNHHTLAVDDQGHVWTTGKGVGGVLGTGTEENSFKDTSLEEEAENRWFEVKGELEGKKVKSVACGSECSFALTEEGKVYAWGFGENLQLGTGDEECELSPVLLEGQQLQGKPVVQVSAGGQHTAILVDQIME